MLHHTAHQAGASPVPELSFLYAPYRGLTRAGERRVQDNLHAHAQNAAIFSPPNRGKTIVEVFSRFGIPGWDVVHRRDNRDKLRTDGQLGPNADLTYPFMAMARTRTARFGVERTNHETTVSPANSKVCPLKPGETIAILFGATCCACLATMLRRVAITTCWVLLP